MIAPMAVLRRAGQEARAVEMKDGSRLLVLPHGGRVLGLFSADHEENFYWTNPALDTVATARELFAGEAWHNSGGDRTWLAPEIDFFLPDFPSRDRYVQQRTLDPGCFRMATSRTGFKLENEFTARLSRSGRKVGLRLVKSLGPALNPLRYERGLSFHGIEYAGYTQHVTLEFTGRSGRTADQVGLWNLVQMPHGGDLLIPTFSRSEPRRVFSTIGTIAPEDLQVGNHMIHYRLRQEGEHKISLRGATVSGRAGYLYRSRRNWSLVIRNFNVNPSGEYIDVPWDEPDWRGFAVQACNVNSGWGKFAEFEYHAPAMGRGTGRTCSEDTSQVWAFRGPRAKIIEIARRLVGEPPAE